MANSAGPADAITIYGGVDRPIGPGTQILGGRTASLPEDPLWFGQTAYPPIQSAEEIAWLASEPRWANRVGAGYKGVRVLGAGAQGVVGLFERAEDSRTSGPRRVVIKQACSRTNAIAIQSLRDECRFLYVLGRTNTKHILKMYKTVVMERALGTSLKYDIEFSDVARIFLEYCEYGDFNKFLKESYTHYTAQNPMLEESIWRVFKCLALALTVIDTGSEDLDGPIWPDEERLRGDDRKQIVHFDITRGNVLIGGKDPDHRRIPVCKIADFGLAREVPAVREQTGGYFNSMNWAGTQTVHPPEQYDKYMYPPRQRVFGNAMNVWQIGKLMYNLTTRCRSFSRDVELFWADLPGNELPTLTMGKPLLDAQYSKELRTTILRCLAYYPSGRPTPRDLVQIIDSSLSLFPDNSSGDGSDGPEFHYPEPDDIGIDWAAALPDPSNLQQAPAQSPPQPITTHPSAFQSWRQSNVDDSDSTSNYIPVFDENVSVSSPVPSLGNVSMQQITQAIRQFPLGPAFQNYRGQSPDGSDSSSA